MYLIKQLIFPLSNQLLKVQSSAIYVAICDHVHPLAYIEQNSLAAAFACHQRWREDQNYFNSGPTSKPRLVRLQTMRMIVFRFFKYKYHISTKIKLLKILNNIHFILLLTSLVLQDYLASLLVLASSMAGISVMDHGSYSSSIIGLGVTYALLVRSINDRHLVANISTSFCFMRCYGRHGLCNCYLIIQVIRLMER